MALESRPSFACLTFIATKGASVEPCPGLSPGQGRQRGCHRQRTGSVTTEEARLVTSSKLKVTSSRSTVPGSSSSVTGTISWALARSTSRSGKWPPGAERFASEIGAVSGERHAYPLGGFPGAAVSENRAFSSDGGRAWGEEGGSSSHCADESRSGGWWVRGAEAGQGRDAYSDGSASTGGQGPGAREGNGAMAAAAHETVEGEGEGVGEGEGIEEGDVDFRGRATWTNKYLLVIAYDGTYFAGWQRQPGKETVQSNVEHALAKVTRQPQDRLGLMVSGRTDAGVHAQGQAAHFVTDAPLPSVRRTFVAVNSVLPRTIRVRRLLSVPNDFHARYSATSKVYHYTVFNAAAHDVFGARTSLWVNMVRLDRGAMRRGAKLFVGTHDFSAFANASVIKERDAVRRIFRFDLVELDDFTFRFEVEGSGFLYKQVRNMVGLLLKIGKRELPPDIVPVLLASRSREELALVATCAKPQGLALHAVHYPSHFFMHCHDASLCQGLDLPSLDAGAESFRDSLRSKEIHS